MAKTVRISRCFCGRVQCEAIGAPIVSAVCYCEDCQEGGRQIEALESGTRVRDEDGGTPYLTYRDDRFTCVSGANLLTGYVIKERAPTERFVASCCNSGMFLKFSKGHWVSAYRYRFDGELPPIEMRNKIAHRQSDLTLPEDVSAYNGFPLKLFWRLAISRLAMLLGR